MTTVQIRIDEKIKNQTKEILDGLGLDMSGAIKIYFQQIIINKGIPFKITEKPEDFPELSQADRFAVAEKSFAFWKSENDDNIFNENISI
ncbi:MAG: hypothetical protein UR28_C0029G0018 [Candidatus Peregrinibacteria bacterium GW2011_GWF2_33_10]|nr:MAG: hypothetical protein UR28_C0029G0018 [Candidatus Peregrinibacteria bacterium GW2011_GWF2_33_10]OGJ45431.1 MAG: hypothetical protein A2263_04155 [Candidatus Peregrinibacteria bacterium RIFOXYA2_FULL_33_21]OGJ45552.1 MAG: hypothetical protein A2272_01075 [Candidatus Peregrinibacteria bacterium RIFOXYA12_FULL_33_12]OGJ51034.1 MAG: hypothetical protein A2307_05750 [Candidatus Peregrinibacteria bacterium RIFOXYB2_FULL_33_20]